jgi:hypothetical protein
MLNRLNRTAPSGRLAAITPSDTAVFTAPIYAIYVGGTGNIAVKAAETGNTVTFTAVPTGTILPILVTQVLSTGTTATNLIGFGG